MSIFHFYWLFYSIKLFSLQRHSSLIGSSSPLRSPALLLLLSLADKKIFCRLRSEQRDRSRWPRQSNHRLKQAARLLANWVCAQRGATAKSQPSKKIRQCRSSVSLETGAFCPCKPDGRHAIRNRAETHSVCPAFCPTAKCGGQAPKLYKLRARLPFLHEPSSLSSEKKKGRIV